MCCTYRMNCCIIGKRVAAFLHGTSTMNDFLLPFSILLNTQCSSCQQPRLYFLDSSISIATGPTNYNWISCEAFGKHLVWRCTRQLLSSVISTKVKAAYLYMIIYVSMQFTSSSSLILFRRVSIKVSVRNDICFWHTFFGQRKHSPSAYLGCLATLQLQPHPRLGKLATVASMEWGVPHKSV